MRSWNVIANGEGTDETKASPAVEPEGVNTPSCEWMSAGRATPDGDIRGLADSWQVKWLTFCHLHGT